METPLPNPLLKTQKKKFKNSLWVFSAGLCHSQAPCCPYACFKFIMALFPHPENLYIQLGSKQEKQWWAILYPQVLGVQIRERFLWNLLPSNIFSKMNVEEVALEVTPPRHLHAYPQQFHWGTDASDQGPKQEKCWLPFVINILLLLQRSL